MRLPSPTDCPAVLFGESCVCTCSALHSTCSESTLLIVIKQTSRASWSFIPAFYNWSWPGSYERAAVNIISQVCCTRLCVTSPQEGSEGGGGERQFHLGPYCSGRDASVRWIWRDGNTEHLVISLARKWLKFLREVMVTGVLFRLLCCHQFKLIFEDLVLVQSLAPSTTFKMCPTSCSKGVQWGPRHFCCRLKVITLFVFLSPLFLVKVVLSGAKVFVPARR